MLTGLAYYSVDITMQNYTIISINIDNFTLRFVLKLWKELEYTSLVIRIAHFSLFNCLFKHSEYSGNLV